MIQEKKLRCPNCHKDFLKKESPFWPFCSERCQLVDLNNWFGEGYCVPSHEIVMEDDLINLEQNSNFID